jgi:hypothetical protein
MIVACALIFIEKISAVFPGVHILRRLDMTSCNCSAIFGSLHVFFQMLFFQIRFMPAGQGDKAGQGDDPLYGVIALWSALTSWRQVMRNVISS